MSRRAWLATVASSVGVWTIGRGHVVHAQERASPGLVDSSNLFAMDQTAARTVRLPSKPGARPSMSPDERDALEHRIRCQCGCTLDVYTCRTTDFSCRVSPAMHRDVMALVDGGYTGDEIMTAFVDVYGERALMAPTKEGFNLVGYVLPGTAIAVGGIALALMLRGWKRQAATRAGSAAAPPALDASPEQMAELEAAIRDDS